MGTSMVNEYPACTAPVKDGSCWSQPSEKTLSLARVMWENGETESA